MGSNNFLKAPYDATWQGFGGEFTDSRYQNLIGMFRATVQTIIVDDIEVEIIVFPPQPVTNFQLYYDCPDSNLSFCVPRLYPISPVGF